MESDIQAAKLRKLQREEATAQAEAQRKLREQETREGELLDKAAERALARMSAIGKADLDDLHSLFLQVDSAIYLAAAARGSPIVARLYVLVYVRWFNTKTKDCTHCKEVYDAWKILSEGNWRRIPEICTEETRAAIKNDLMSTLGHVKPTPNQRFAQFEVHLRLTDQDLPKFVEKARQVRDAFDRYLQSLEIAHDPPVEPVKRMAGAWFYKLLTSHRQAWAAIKHLVPVRDQQLHRVDLYDQSFINKIGGGLLDHVASLQEAGHQSFAFKAPRSQAQPSPSSTAKGSSTSGADKGHQGGPNGNKHRDGHHDSNNSNNKRKGDKFCTKHGWCFHATAECRDPSLPAVQASLSPPPRVPAAAPVHAASHSAPPAAPKGPAPKSPAPKGPMPKGWVKFSANSLCLPTTTAVPGPPTPTPSHCGSDPSDDSDSDGKRLEEAPSGHLFVSCRVHGFKVPRALLDTAAPTCISLRMLDEIRGARPLVDKMDTQNLPALEAWNGTPVPVLGRVSLELKFAGRSAVHDVLVVTNGPAELVLGADVLRKFGPLTLDWKHRRISLQDQPQVAVAVHGVPPVPGDSTAVRVLERVSIRPFTAVWLHVVVPEQREGMHLFSPDKDFEARRRVTLAEGVCSSTCCGVVWAANHTAQSITLRPGDVIGTLSRIATIRTPTELTDDEWKEALDATPVASTRGRASSLRPTASVGDKDRTEDSVAEPPIAPSQPSAPQELDISPDVPPEQREAIREMVARLGLFCPPVGVGLSNAPPMEVKLKPGAVINNRNYPASLDRQQAAMNIAQELWQGGVIHPSTSAFNSPVVLARKADGSWRFCVDYRQVNAATERDAYQLPRTTDLLDQLGGSRIFSVLDLASAFWQIRLAKEAQQYTAFSLLSGHWEFGVVPMGLCNSPSVMQRSLEEALGDILYRGALAYIDDIIVYGRTWEEHNRRLEIVLRRLREYGFHTRANKCKFGYHQVKFLGHLVSEEGVMPWPGNLEKIRNCTVPTDTKMLASTLALFSYYRRFIEGYANLARPLVDRLTAEQKVLAAQSKNPRKAKGALRLTEAEVKVFEELKARLSADNNLLALPDWEQPFVLETDSSDFFGHATLSQYEPNSKTRLRPVAFHSFTIPPKRWKRGAYEREFYCLVEGVRHFSNYLDRAVGVEVRVDQQALRFLHTQARTNPAYGTWVQVLSPYKIKWVYQPAELHRHIDCFTRPPFTEDLAARLDDPAFMSERLLADADSAATCVFCNEEHNAAGKCNMRIEDTTNLSLEAAREGTFRGRNGEGKIILPTSHPVTEAVLCAFANRTSIEEAEEEEEEDNASLSSPQPARLPRTPQEIGTAQRADPVLGPVIDFLEKEYANTPCDHPPAVRMEAERYFLAESGILYFIDTYGSRRRNKDEQEFPIAVPAAMRGEFLKAYHTDSTSAHLASKKALPRMRRECYWPQMTRDLIAFESECASCMEHKVPRRGPVGDLHSISATQPWEMIGMDILGPLPTSRRGYNYVIVFMDYFSRYVIIRPLRTQTAAEVARVLMSAVLLDRAPPARLLSDRGSAFRSDLLKELYELFGVHKVYTSAYHPQTDGMVERFNHTLVAMLSHYVSCEQDDWDQYLLAVQFAYNTAQHASHLHTPHEVAHGWVARTPTLAPLGSPLPPIGVATWMARLRQHSEAMGKLVIDLDAAAKARNEQRHAERRIELVFAKGQLVYRKNEVMTSKLDKKLLGPFEVLDANDTDGYLIRRANDKAAVGEWVHVSKLYPSYVPYDATEVDNGEGELSDADEPEFRPMDTDIDAFIDSIVAEAEHGRAASPMSPASAAPMAPAAAAPSAPTKERAKPAAPKLSMQQQKEKLLRENDIAVTQQLEAFLSELAKVQGDQCPAPMRKQLLLILEQIYHTKSPRMVALRTRLRDTSRSVVVAVANEIIAERAPH